MGANIITDTDGTKNTRPMIAFETWNWNKIINSRLISWSWWRHQMKTFSALLALCAGNSPVPGVFPAQRPVPRSFDVFFDLRLVKRLSKWSWDWWFHTLSRPLWRHSNVIILNIININSKYHHRPFLPSNPTPNPHPWTRRIPHHHPRSQQPPPSNGEQLCFLCCYLEQAVEQAIELQMICDDVTPIGRHCSVSHIKLVTFWSCGAKPTSKNPIEACPMNTI